MLGNMLQYWMVKEKGRREWASLISSAEGGTLPILENKVIKLYYWGMFHFLNKITVCLLSRFSCVWLCDAMESSPPDSSVHEILQTRTLEWVSMPSSRGFSQPRYWNMFPAAPALQVDSLLLSHQGSQKNPTRNDSNIREKETQPSVQFSSVQFSHSVMSESLWTHGLQHTRPPCPSPPLRVYSNPCPLSQWCHPTISSSVIPFPSSLQSFPASGSFQMSGQSIGVSASASVLPMNTQDWFPSGWTGWIFLLSRVFSNTTVQKYQFFSAQLSLDSNSHIHTWLLEKS